MIDSVSMAPAPAASTDNPDALRPGTRLDEFEIVRVLGSGGFGIVYLALDQVLLRYVAIKEYLPNTLAERGRGPLVTLRSKAHEATFSAGLDSFINEARMLASFDHPSLVKVHRFWKSNATAYMVMQYYAGQTLKDARRAFTAPPDEAWLRGVLDPLLGALELLHSEGVYHRDIAPDNILLMPDGQPVVLDFGSARRVIGDQTQSLTALLKPNFSPVEQYADEGNLRQGPFTDLYALGATVHFMLTGKAPMPAVMRAVRDSMHALSTEPALYPGVTPAFLATIDWTLALAPGDRPQSVQTLRDALRGDISPPPLVPRLAAQPFPFSSPFNATLALAQTEVFADTARVEPARSAATDDQPQPERSRATRAANAGTRRSMATFAAVAIVALGALVSGSVWLSRAASTSVAGAPADSSSAVFAAPASTAIASTSAAASVPVPALVSMPVPVAAASRAAAMTASVDADRSRDAKTRSNASEAQHAPAPATPRTTTTTTKAPSLAAVDRAKPNAAPETAPRASVATLPTTAAATPRAPAALCANLGFFAANACLQRTCQEPTSKNDPQCIEVRRVAEQRQRRMEQ